MADEKSTESKLRPLDLNVILELYLRKGVKEKIDPDLVVSSVKYAPLIDSASDDYKSLLTNATYQDVKPYSIKLDPKSPQVELNFYKLNGQKRFVIWTRPMGDVDGGPAGVRSVIGMVWDKSKKVKLFWGTFYIRP